MEQPLVTIVVPVYNVERYLDQCIESLVSQTYKNLEIILVDDGSLDSSSEMCDDWSERDARIKVVHKVNEGLGMARNTGLELATGKYIFFFDSDDYVDVTIVEKCLQSAEANQADVVIFGRNEVYEDGRVIQKYINSDKLLFRDEEVRGDILPGMFTYDKGFGVSAWGKMYRLETIMRFGKKFLSERDIISEDAYFATDLFSEISTVSIVRECLYFYRKRNNSLSREYRKDRHEKNNEFFVKTQELINLHNLPYKVLNHLAARYQMYCIADMKQIVAADIARREKQSELRKIYKDDTLRESLTNESLRLHSLSLEIFFKLLKFKLFLICDLFLLVKVKLKE